MCKLPREPGPYAPFRLSAMEDVDYSMIDQTDPTLVYALMYNGALCKPRSFIEISGGGGGTIAIEDEGIVQCASATTINFVGAGVTAICVAGIATVNIPISPGPTSQAYIERFVATAGQTVFTVANVPASPEFVWVSNGSAQYSKQNALDDYTVAGSNITFNTGRVVGEIVTIQYISVIAAPGVGYVTIENDGVPLPQRTIMNFVGKNHKITDNPPATDIIIRTLVSDTIPLGETFTVEPTEQLILYGAQTILGTLVNLGTVYVI